MNQITHRTITRPKFQFRLRTLLLMCGVLSAVLGAVTSRLLEIATVYDNVAWLEKQGVQIASNFQDRYGLLPGQRSRKWQALFEWTVASPDEVQAALSAEPQLPQIVDKLGRMSSIRRINLTGSEITSDDVKRLAGLPNLEKLLLTGTPIDDSAADSLMLMSKLRSLDLSQTKISDASLQQISKIKSLEWVNLLQTNVSEKGLDDLRQARPDLVIYPQFLDAAPMAPLSVADASPFFDVQTKPG